MKYLLPCLLILGLQARSQECKLIHETDPYTKQLKISTGFLELEGASLTIDVNKQAGSGRSFIKKGQQ